VTHIDPHDLERWWTRGDEADRARIVAHLAVCDECIERYGALMDAQPAEAPPHTPIDAVLPLGRRAGGRIPWLRWAPWQIAAAAAAAMVLVAVLLSPAVRDQAGDPGELAIRSSRLTLLEPIGRVSSVPEFRWASPVEAARFRVELFDPAGQTIWTAVVETPVARLPEAVHRTLQPRVEYRWRTTALDADGQPMMQSGTSTFVIRP
jgi:hypothetical protein